MRAILFSLTALAFAGAAQAQSVGSSASLQSPVDGARSFVSEGVQWRCAGQACVAVGEPASQPVLRACRRFTAEFGAVTAFTYGGRSLPAEQVADCNARARGATAISVASEAR